MGAEVPENESGRGRWDAPTCALLTRAMQDTTQAGKTVTTEDIQPGDMVVFERETHLGTQVFRRRAKATHGDEVHLVTTGIEDIEDVIGVEADDR